MKTQLWRREPKKQLASRQLSARPISNIMSALSEKIYGAGHANLDRDHDVLLRIASELRDLTTDPPRLERIGRELLAYMDAHFEDEERL